MCCTKCERDNHTGETCFGTNDHPLGYKGVKVRQGTNNNKITLGNASGPANLITSSGDNSLTISL